MSLKAQKSEREFYKMLKKDEVLKPILEQSQKYGIQIIYTQIDESDSKNIVFKTFHWGKKKPSYFYPASTVKFPAVLLAYEKMNKLGLNVNSPLKVTSSIPNYLDLLNDTTAQNGYASVVHLAKKIFLVSDNEAFNTLYDFIGQAEFNKRLHEKGYQNVGINHRLSVPLSASANAQSPAVTFFNAFTKQELYNQAPQSTSVGKFFAPKPILLGKGYYKNDSLITQPMNFAEKNNFPLDAQHQMLKALFYPEQVDKNWRFNLSETQRASIINMMATLPRESDFPKYDPKHYPDDYAKFFIYGSSQKSAQENIKIYNKIGLAYGFLIDNALIENTLTGKRFLLSAVINVNENQIYNDDTYSYETIGLPFLARLGTILFENTK